jgi:exonuclease SbcC
MRIDKITLCGFTTYKQEAVLDLAGLGPGIIAIAGPNGSGKTTLLEAVPGAVYRQTPSRGNIAAMATVRDARIEIIGENGSPFVIRLDVDVHTGKQEAVIIDGAGEPLAGPKVREFDAYIAAHFPAFDVYLASFFASQTGVGSVLKMSRSDRRALFGRLLGLERLEEMATAARERARQVETGISSIRTALEALGDGAVNIGDLEAALGDVRFDSSSLADSLKKTKDRLRAMTAERDRLAAARLEEQRAEKTAREIQSRADRLALEAEGVRRDLGALDAILKDAPAIRQHAAVITTLAGELEEMRARGESAAAEERKVADEAAKLEREAAKAENLAREANLALADANAKLEDSMSRKELAEESTSAVPCAGSLADNIRAGCSALSGHFRIRDEARDKIVFLEAAMPELLEKINQAIKEREETVAKARTASEISSQARVRAEEIRIEYRKANERLTDMRSKDRTPQLDRAEAEAGVLRVRLLAVTDQAAEAKAAAECAAAECPKIDNNLILEAEEAVRKAEQDLQGATQADQEAQRAVARLEAQVESAKAAKAKADELSARITPLERDLAGWRFLARGLGREGVQALELDAAGPRVSGLANELLADAYGSRFQIRFETQAAKADGKGVKETFDIVVVDTEKGREGNGEDLSGGEKVIVGEALGMAVGLFHAQAAGVSLGTVIRDETVGALDPENGEKYLAMLRAFLRVGHVHQLLYVAHQPALIDMADAVVRVEDGRIEVK